MANAVMACYEEMKGAWPIISASMSMPAAMRANQQKRRQKRDSWLRYAWLVSDGACKMLVAKSEYYDAIHVKRLVAFCGSIGMCIIAACAQGLVIKY